ncbi:MAG: UDP-4-amino-4,6-dideoxy-N-acetyl-beta-L-altrosamine transaminase [Desulfonatronovibrio sp.]
MKIDGAPLVDSNILLYSANLDSPFYHKAVDILAHYTRSGLYVADINLIEFFQVITDGRKTACPFSPEKASEFIKKFVDIPDVCVLKTRTLHEILFDHDLHEEIKAFNIKRFDIYDYLIADCMRANQVTTIITGNIKDFKKFDFIQAINPFTTPRTPDHGPWKSNPEFIPYGRQSITEQDVSVVCSVLRSDFLTQGPVIPRFEQAVADYCRAKYAVAVNSATSALHLACMALGLRPSDILWTSPITFVASANCALYCGAEVDFVDIDPRTYNMSPKALESKLETAKESGKLPKVVVAVHMCGQSCDMQFIHALSKKYGFKIIEDASHAIGGQYQNRPVGNCRYSDITVFSFHPVKIITTGEGGLTVTNNAELAERMALLRSHGITRKPKSVVRSQTSDIRRPPDHGPQASNLGLPAYYYEQIALGHNYRMTDIQAALGLSQMNRLDEFVARRRELAMQYDNLLADLPLTIPWQHPDCSSAWHLYVVRLDLEKINVTRRQVFEYLRKKNIGVNVHYIPVHTQPYYQAMGFGWGMFPEAEKYYQEAITLPLFPAMTDEEQNRVVDVLREGVTK